ncbi:MAG TPA: hypothetical protein EYH12_04975 [Psychromonas hadalis]|nr:hypothetical protein [Psychromonas hadalis]
MIYKQFTDFLEAQCGIVLGDNKQYLVKSRLQLLMVKFSIESIEDIIHAAMGYKKKRCSNGGD